MKRLNQFPRQILFIVAMATLAACASKSQQEQTHEAPPVFKQTLKGYMAELGQYMDDVYRFWDSKSMHEVSLQRLDQMIEIHDHCLNIFSKYLDDHSIEEYRDQHKAFENYLLKSRELTLELKDAVISKDDDLITQAFGNLDQNRRDAHSAFGRAL